MNKETLEEAAEKRIPTSTKVWDLTETRRSDFIAGAKWQAERMYSEEEAGELVYSIIGQYANQVNIMIDGDIVDRLFKQFKKKT